MQDRFVLEWARGLPGNPETYIVSLLGTKPDGRSEFSFYSSFKDAEAFEAWLNTNVAGRRFHVISQPTTDCQEIDPAVLTTIAADVLRLISQGATIVVMDSGGHTRSGAVANHLGATSASGRM